MFCKNWLAYTTIVKVYTLENFLINYKIEDFRLKKLKILLLPSTKKCFEENLLRSKEKSIESSLKNKSVKKNLVLLLKSYWLISLVIVKILEIK